MPAVANPYKMHQTNNGFNKRVNEQKNAFSGPLHQQKSNMRIMEVYGTNNNNQFLQNKYQFATFYGQKNAPGPNTQYEYNIDGSTRMANSELNSYQSEKKIDPYQQYTTH